MRRIRKLKKNATWFALRCQKPTKRPFESLRAIAQDPHFGTLAVRQHCIFSSVAVKLVKLAHIRPPHSFPKTSSWLIWGVDLNWISFYLTEFQKPVLEFPNIYSLILIHVLRPCLNVLYLPLPLCYEGISTEIKQLLPLATMMISGN